MSLDSHKILADSQAFAESIVIQSLMAEFQLIDKFGLDVALFQINENKQLYEVCQACLKEKIPPEINALQMRFAGHFNNVAFCELFNTYWPNRKFNKSPNIEYYINILKDRKLKKEMVMVLKVDANLPALEQLETIASKAKDLIVKNTPESTSTFSKDLQHVIQVAEDASQGIYPHSLKTGYDKLDDYIEGGILEDYLIVLGAESGCGKTTFALNLIKNISRGQRYSSLYLSFEMSRYRLMQWFIAACTSIPINNFRNGKITDDDFGKISRDILAGLCQDPILIEEPVPEIDNVTSIIRKKVEKNPQLKFIVIDHLHLMHVNNSNNPVDAQSKITKSLKQLAMELKVPILLIAQLKKPQDNVKQEVNYHMLKGSGSVITDADLIMILQKDNQPNFATDHKIIRNYVLKNRGGRASNTEFIPMAHYPSIGLIKVF